MKVRCNNEWHLVSPASSSSLQFCSCASENLVVPVRMGVYYISVGLENFFNQARDGGVRSIWSWDFFNGQTQHSYAVNVTVWSVVLKALPRHLCFEICRIDGYIVTTFH
jgi:hypothetical protein